MNLKTRSDGWHIQWILFALVTLCFASCKDDDGQAEPAFDPSKPIVITDFTPKEGGLGSRLVLYGNNFGNDISKIRVTIGGQKANVIGIKNQSLYCFVPARAYDGGIEVSILGNEGEEIAYTEAEEKFLYQKKMLVTTLLGVTKPEITDENSNFDVKNGPWTDCGGLEKMEWMVFDPNNKNRLYVCGGAKSHRIVDFSEETLGTISFSGGASGSANVLSFTNDGQLIVVRDIANETTNAIFFFSPESNFTAQTKAMTARGCRAATPHPVNGEIYTSRYDKGWIGRYDPVTGENEPSKIQMYRASIELFVAIHPTGNYMYIMVRNRHVIYRADYNWETKTFGTPYLASGKDGETGCVDGVGSMVRMNQPQQGCFAPNPDYAGQADEYDFYFADKQNQCIRVMTPAGKVTVYAGRPNGDGAKGFNDGDLRTQARFNYPASIVYDEVRGWLLVGDSNNHRIRKIAYEE